MQQKKYKNFWLSIFLEALEELCARGKMVAHVFMKCLQM